MKNTFYILSIIFLLTINFLCIRKVPNSNISIIKKPFDTSNIDKSISPIADFDKFVNGKWQDTTKIPMGYPRWGAFNILNDENESKIKDIIKSFIKTSSDNKKSEPEQQICDLYLSYLDTNIIENRNISAFKNIFLEIDQVKNLQTLNNLYFAKYSKYISNWINYEVNADAKNSRKNILYIGQGGLSIGDRDYYIIKNQTNQKILNEFIIMNNKYLKYIGILDSIKANSLSEELLDFEMKLAKIQITKEQRRDPVLTYNKVNTTEISSKYLNIGLDKMFSVLPKIDSCVIENIQYLSNLDYLLRNTNIEILKLWFKIKFINTYAAYLSNQYKETNRYFYSEVLNGIKSKMSREKEGIKLVNHNLSNVLGKIFVSKYFPESSKKKVIEMIENMRSVYEERIEQNKWMEPATKKAALIKLKALKYKIGYPDKWKNYSSIEINKNNLIENLFHINNWNYNEMINKINKDVDSTEWYMSPQIVNAYYNPLDNEIVFPAGILQPPFYNPNADDAINYGGILAVIGHELTHGFDDQGSQFDEKGNLRNWWTKEDMTKFKDKGNFLKEIYENYKGLKSKSKINGQFTLGENIADLGGVTLAYNALLKSFKGKQEPKDIDGYNYKQRFFLSWAQVWRTKSTLEFEKNQVIQDPHSPANARINVTLSLFPEFYKAFGNEISKNNVIEIW